MTRRVEPRIVALSSAAVLAIYGAGYGLTQSTVNVRRQIAAAVQAVPRTLRDGTFHGTGTSPFGNVSVALTVHATRITNVQITSVTTFFSAGWISGLPNEVIARQSPAVDVVSGATGSTLAFVSAVQDALRHAAVIDPTVATRPA